MWEERLQQAEGQKAEEGRVERFLEKYVNFPCLLAFIVLISLMDGSLVVLCGTLPAEEHNPVGKLLILSHGQWGLLFAKVFGTAVVVAILVFLYKIWRPAAQLAVGVMALFQLILLWYLFS